MGKIPQQTPAPQAIPPEPTYLPVSPDTIPAELKAHRQWVAWAPKYKLSNQKKPWTKILKNPATGKNAMSNTPHTWGSFKDAMRCYKQRGFAGVGFVPTANDLYCGIDLDNCRDPLTGEIAPWAQEMIDRFASYTEVSPSGTGIRIWIKGKLPPGARNKDQKRGIEVYDEGQYLTITGCHPADTPLTIEPRQQELQAWHMEVFGKPTPAPERPSVVVADMNGQPPAMTDDDVIKLSRESKKSGAKFKRLWVGDISGYASMSEATQGLVNLLVFVTRNHEQLDRLMRRFGLYRDKWDDKRGESTWGQNEIDTALGFVKASYTPSVAITVDETLSPEDQRSSLLAQVSTACHIPIDRLVKYAGVVLKNSAAVMSGLFPAWSILANAMSSCLTT